MNHLRTVWLSGLLGYRALFAWNTPGLFAASLIVTPLLQVVFFVALGASLNYGSASFFVVGNSIQLVAAAGVFGMVSVIADERRFGTLSVILGSPGSRIAVFVGRMLPGAVLGLLVALMTSAVGFTITGWPMSGARYGAFVAVAGVASFSCAAFGLTLSAAGLIYREIFQIATASYFVLMLLSGANVSRQELPAWARGLGEFLPTAHAIDAARFLASGSADLRGVGSSLILEAVVGACWLVVALVAMRLLERTAKRRAALELY